MIQQLSIDLEDSFFDLTFNRHFTAYLEQLKLPPTTNTPQTSKPIFPALLYNHL